MVFFLQEGCESTEVSISSGPISSQPARHHDRSVCLHQRTDRAPPLMQALPSWEMSSSKGLMCGETLRVAIKTVCHATSIVCCGPERASRAADALESVQCSLKAPHFRLHRYQIMHAVLAFSASPDSLRAFSKAGHERSRGPCCLCQALTAVANVGEHVALQPCIIKALRATSNHGGQICRS